MSRIVSWNVNGIRACSKKGLAPWLLKEDFDIVLFQEVRASLEQIPEDIVKLPGYFQYWNPAKNKKGYSGTGLLCKKRPEKIYQGLGKEEFDLEGRLLGAEFQNLIVMGVYFPNSQEKGRRLTYKLNFCLALWEWLEKMKRKKKPLLCSGDFNIAHKPIDLADPHSNEDSPGYLPEERAWMEDFLEIGGWVDSFRYLHPKRVSYSWFSARTRARERNKGWRIDYHTLSKSEADRIIEAEILYNVLGSDHCPVTLNLRID